MKNKLILLLLLMINYQFSVAQTDSIPPKLTIGLSPITLLGGDFTANTTGFNVTIGKPNNKGLEWEQEITYLTRSIFDDPNETHWFLIDVHSLQGVKLATEVRYNFGIAETLPDWFKLDIYAGLIAKNFFTHTGCEIILNGEPFLYHINRFRHAFTFVLGSKRYALGSEKLFFSSSVGYGLQYIHDYAEVPVTDLPEQATDTFGLTYGEARNWVAHLHLDMKINYVF